MNGKNGQLRIQVDWFTRACLAAITVLLVLLVCGLWANNGWSDRDARAAEFGDTGAQRKAILDAQDKTNEKMDELIKLFRSGDAKVQLANPAEQGPAKDRAEGNAGKAKAK
jgi:hypothetical protein